MTCRLSTLIVLRRDEHCRHVGSCVTVPPESHIAESVGIGGAISACRVALHVHAREPFRTFVGRRMRCAEGDVMQRQMTLTSITRLVVFSWIVLTVALVWLSR